MAGQINLQYQNDEKGEVGAPYLFLPLYPGDRGNRDAYTRSQKAEYVHRKPSCIVSLTREGVQLLIGNSGAVASDLVIVEYQVVFCTAEEHGPADGFAFTHAGEQHSEKGIDSFQNIAFIPAGTTVPYNIKFRDWPHGYLANLYFRAKVSTMWEEEVASGAANKWDFASDVRVTEAHLAVI